VYVNKFTCCLPGGPASDPGRLSLTDITVNITVLASNNPYGMYVFANGSLDVSVAEDSTDNSVSLLVEKTPGATDYLHVITCLFCY